MPRLASFAAALALLLVQVPTPAAEPAPAAALWAATLTGTEGDTVDFARLRGKPLLVNFWATWCAPCREEIPHLIRLHGRYAPRGLAVVGLAIDDSEHLRSFVRLKGIGYPVARAGERGIALMRELGNQTAALPFTVVLDAEGRVVYLQRGAFDPAALKRVLEALGG